ncbi:hypothetical protein ACVU7I_00250 [Patulibacter sp. S7RM1-6]
MSPQERLSSTRDRRGGRWRRTMLAGVVSAVAACGLSAAATPAGASTLVITDSSGYPTTTFGRNQVVAGYGNITYRAPGLIIPTADYWIVPNSSWSGGERLTGRDVRNPPVRIQRLGTFVDEPLWMPNLQPGKYDVIVDANLNGVYNPATDLVLGAGTNYAFRVTGQTFPGQAPAVANIKQRAGERLSVLTPAERSRYWLNWYFGPTGTALASFADRTLMVPVHGSIQQVVGSGLKLGAAAINVATSRPSLAFLLVNQTAGRALGYAAARDLRLYEDPLDPLYGLPVVTTLSEARAEIEDQFDLPGDGRTYPLVPVTTDPAEAREARLTNLQLEQAALVDALTDANERYLGAQEATDIRWAVAHVRSMNQTITRLRAVTGDILDLLDELRVDIAATPNANETVDVSELEALKTRLSTTGLTTEEETSFTDLGYSTAQIEGLVDSIVANSVPEDDFTPLQVHDDLVDGYEAFLDELDDLEDQTGDLIPDLQTTVETVALPSVTAAVTGTPTAGTASTLTATPSGGTGTLTVRWDTDLDGEFDDATGTTTTFTPPTPTRHLVGVQVSDARGLTDTTYLALEAEPSSAQPTLSTITPTNSGLDIDAGDSQTFTVATPDPSATYEWRVDGTVVGTAASYTLTTGPTEKAVRSIVVSVRSSDPHALRTQHSWIASITP